LSSRFGILAIGIFFMSPLAGQNHTVGAPALGFALDKALERLRPLQGIPGAALLGAPLDSGGAVAHAAISPRQDYALVWEGGGRPGIFTLPGGPATPLDGAFPAPDRIVLSPQGSAAALCRDAAIQIVTGLPHAPTIRREIDASVAGAGAPGPVAVSDDGEIVAAAFALDGQGILMLFTAEGPRQLAVSGVVSALAFRPGSRDLLAADQTNALVYAIHGVDGSPCYRILATAMEGVSSPVAVEFSADGARAFVADPGAGGILVLDAGSGGAALLPCQGAPTGLHRLNGNSVFRLNEISAGPLYVLDASGARPRIVFVPPLLAEAIPPEDLP
jgi:hypothetical protein